MVHELFIGAVHETIARLESIQQAVLFHVCESGTGLWVVPGRVVERWLRSGPEVLTWFKQEEGADGDVFGVAEVLSHLRK